MHNGFGSLLIVRRGELLLALGSGIMTIYVPAVWFMYRAAFLCRRGVASSVLPRCDTPRPAGNRLWAAASRARAYDNEIRYMRIHKNTSSSIRIGGGYCGKGKCPCRTSLI